MKLSASDIISTFTPKQQLAFSAFFTHRFALYGGARGGGKSHLLRLGSILWAIYLYKKRGLRKVRLGLFANTYPELQDRHINRLEADIPPIIGKVSNSQEHGLAFVLNDDLGGGVIALRNLDKPEKYRSSEFAAVFVDELTLTTKETFDYLRGSLRWPGLNHTIFVGATNPGGIGMGWVKQLWIDRQFPPELQPLADQFIFIPALPSDNPYLDRTYWENLNSLPEDLRKAWVEGNWDTFAGMAFPGWSKDRHVVSPFDIPKHWPRWRAIDWGFSAPWVCLWFAKDPDTGRIYVYREAAMTGLTDRQQARMVKELTPPDEYITITYADPSMWSAKTMGDTVSSTADEYAREGVPLTRADNDRLNGKRKVDRLLMDLPDGKPGLQIFSTCEYLIRTLPALPYSKTHPEDVDTAADDHSYDSLRYGLTNTNAHRQPVSPVKKTYQHNPLASRYF